jgi:hypothetical protein
MTTKLQVRIYPSRLTAARALYFYETTSDGPHPKAGDSVRFDLADLSPTGDGVVQTVSWASNFSALIVDVVVDGEALAEALAEANEWISLEEQGAPERAASSSSMFIPGRIR